MELIERIEYDLTEKVDMHFRTVQVQESDLRELVDLVKSSRDIVAEYLEAKRIIDAGPQPTSTSGFAAPKTWKHNDPEVRRWHRACADLYKFAGERK